MKVKAITVVHRRVNKKLVVVEPDKGEDSVFDAPQEEAEELLALKAVVRVADDEKKPQKKAAAKPAAKAAAKPKTKPAAKPKAKKADENGDGTDENGDDDDMLD